jgi:opacity protein-like surface antigen
MKGFDMTRTSGMVHMLAALLLAGSGMAAQSQTLDTRFACSQVADDGGERVTYADSGEMHLDGDKIKGFHWESALYRATHGYDCNIDEEDELKAEVAGNSTNAAWRVGLVDGRGARDRRGYNFERGVTCTIGLERTGDTVKVRPACPALCGSRLNFSAISIDVKSGICRYE